MDEADVSDWFVRTQLATIALFDPAWRELATGAIGPFFEPRDTIPGQREWPRNFDSPEDRLCVRELWGFLVRGERGRPHLRRANLAAVTWDDGVPALRRYEQMGRGFCNAAMEALEETAADPAGPAPALARLDTLMMNRPFNGWFPASGNLVLARLHERRGDRDAALAALRRPKNENQGGDLLATIYLREEGRLARATGDIDGAIRVYRHYLLLRRAPDEVTWPQVDSVCAELRDISETAADAYSICRHGRAESLGGAS